MASAQSLTIAIDEAQQVSALLQVPQGARACYVMAHGAGAGMTHPFMTTMANVLAERGVATLRYQFPYMERGAKRVDPPKVAQATVRRAIERVAESLPGLPLFAGGKSFGGRMTSQAQAEAPLPAVRGLVFLGFPLHPPGKPSDERAKHLSDVRVPTLFLQGTRDEFAQLDLLRPLIERLHSRATLHLVEGGDHSFKVPAAAGRRPAEVMAELGDAVLAWARLT